MFRTVAETSARTSLHDNGMIVGIGTDIVDIQRIAETLKLYGERFEQRVFVDEEIFYCRLTPRRTAERFAARFAAKEAFSKAVGIGMYFGFRWREVTVQKLRGGAPVLELRGGMAARYGDLTFHLSLTHTDTMAMAVVVAERRE